MTKICSFVLITSPTEHFFGASRMFKILTEQNQMLFLYQSTHLHVAGFCYKSFAILINKRFIVHPFSTAFRCDNLEFQAIPASITWIHIIFPANHSHRVFALKKKTLPYGCLLNRLFDRWTVRMAVKPWGGTLSKQWKTLGVGDGRKCTT